MTPALANLYQERILAHHRKPHHFGPLPEATMHKTLRNPLCGDEVTLHLQVEHNTIVRCHFEGEGCLLCRASASMLTDWVAGKSLEQARKRAAGLVAFLESGGDGMAGEELGELVVFSGVREHPSRVKCVSLPWHAL